MVGFQKIAIDPDRRGAFEAAVTLVNGQAMSKSALVVVMTSSLSGKRIVPLGPRAGEACIPSAPRLVLGGEGRQR